MSTLKGDLALMYVFALMSHNMIYTVAAVELKACLFSLWAVG